MNRVSLNDIKIIDLKKNYSNKSGEVMHFIKRTDDGFKEFGEVYFSWIKFKKIKAWKQHSKMILNLVVPIGSVRFVFHIPDQKREFRIEEIGYSNYKRLIVPPGIWFGFKGIEKPNNLVSNFSNIIHDTKESIQVDQNFFSYKW